MLLTMNKEEASELLSRNWPGNRPQDTARVKSYRWLMNAGQWLPDFGSKVTLSVDGYLVNGQHRLRAFIDSNLNEITVPFAIQYN